MPSLFQISYLEAIANGLTEAECAADDANEMINVVEYPGDYGEEYIDLCEEFDNLRARIADLHGDVEDLISRVVELRERHPEA